MKARYRITIVPDKCWAITSSYLVEQKWPYEFMDDRIKISMFPKSDLIQCIGYQTN
jgi:hypothetical protein